MCVIPDADGRPLAYFSVQRKPGIQGVSTIAPLYREMLRIEQRQRAGEAAESESLAWLLRQIEAAGGSYDSYIHSLGY